MTKLTSTNPGNNYEVIGEVEVSSADDIATAIQAAKAAAKDWRALGVDGRLPYFEKLVSVMEAKAEEFAELQTRETGKTIRESRDEIRESIESIQWHIDNAEQYLQPELLDETETAKLEMYKEPYGVVATIVPWNFPVGNFVEAAIQLLICGNVVVFKHSEECPLVGKMIADVMAEAGFAFGVFSQVYGGGQVGQMLVEADIDMLSFTGSSRVGKQLYKQAADKFIHARMELGGSSPGLVFEDADLDTVIPSCCDERFLACGQVCCALKRLFVHESVAAEVTTKLKQQVEAMKMGDPSSEATDIGPLVAERQQMLLKNQLDDAVAKGAEVVTGGAIPDNLRGAYFEPTILIDVTPNMRILQEEVFGPVLPIVVFRSEQEAIDLANSTDYGLSAFVYSADQERALRVASQIEAGMLSINGASYFSGNASFGGYKSSGIGRANGKYGYYESTQTKVVATKK